MNIAKYVSLGLASALLPSIVAAEPDPELVYHLTNRLANFDARLVSAETRSNFLSELRIIRNNEGMRFRYEGVYSEIMSLELGDTEFIEQLYIEWLSYSTFRKRAGISPFREARNPEFVGRFIQHLDWEIPKPDGSVEQDLQKSIAYTIQNQLKRCPHFNATTREWANSLTLSGIRPLLHDFWEHNKERFTAKDYRAIYPPGMEPPPSRERGVPAIAMQLKHRPKIPDSKYPGAPREPAPASPAEQPDPRTFQPPEPKAAEPPSAFPFALLAMLTGGTLWWFLKRR